MIMPNIPGKAKCPKCGSENVKFKWSITTIVAWTGKLLGVPTVKNFEKMLGVWTRVSGIQEMRVVYDGRIETT